jgi:NAD+ synthase (glutamine-hydrolysing)
MINETIFPMTAPLSVVIAQLNAHVGDIDGNTEQCLSAIKNAITEHDAGLIIFPELMLSGYPPEDLLLRPSLEKRINTALQRLCDAVSDIYVIVGYPRLTPSGLYNMAGVIHEHKIIFEYAKQELPNYRVFDEKRYFHAGTQMPVLEINGITTAICICEDIWQTEPIQQAKSAGAELIITINASPFHIGKQQERLALLRERSQAVNLPIIYANMVGAQDELVFDGGSCAVNADGTMAMQTKLFTPGLFSLSVTKKNQQCFLQSAEQHPPLEKLASVYQALVCGVRDYINKNHFKGVVLGLSGGIDSALTLAIAVDALGKERVSAVMMPFHYTAQMSLDDAAAQAKRLGIDYHVLPIAAPYDSLLQLLAPQFANTTTDKTEENLQARIRGVLLMALSNKHGSLVLTTGNKSEMAVGYSTLYGDMAGGFDVLKDVPKTLVFELAKYRNQEYRNQEYRNQIVDDGQGEIIPQRVITRPPSAELAPDQKDQDSLPPYEILDQILELYVEQDCSADEIIQRGFASDVVMRITRLVDINEYKRRQAPIGPRITQRGFGRDRRYPITSGWKPGV